jgi:NTE family protein
MAPAKRTFDHQILLLQGGGALGAYHAGVYEGLVELGHAPTWVVGVSIGAITAALIAGNPPERRVARLHAFWDRISSYAPQAWPPGLPSMRQAFNFMSAGTVAAFGAPGFFSPRVPAPFFAMGAGPATTSFYDTEPLRRTLEELVDFDRIHRGDVRISLGAVNVRTGQSVYFDSQLQRIGPEHVMASGALPPGFPAVEIDGQHYWDGGIVSNSPLTYVADQKPMTTALMVQIDLFKAAGEMPTTLDEVAERHKDIQYASKQRITADRIQEIAELRAALARLIARLPAKLRDDPDARHLAASGDERQWTLLRLTNQRLPHVSQTKDFEFSRATVTDHWDAGLEDVRRAATRQDWLHPRLMVPGLTVHDLTD